MKLRYILTSLVLFIVEGCLFSIWGDEAPARMYSLDREVNASLSKINGRLGYTVIFHGDTVINHSLLGWVIDGDTLGQDVSFELVRKSVLDETYGTRGFHEKAVNKAVEYTYLLRSSGRPFYWQARLYDDGFAFRYLLENERPVHVNGELTTFCPSRGLPVWFFERTSEWKLKTYAGIWTRTRSDSLATISPTGPVQGAVLVYELPKGKFMAITEAALYDYSGMRLKAREDASLQVDFTEGDAGFPVEDHVKTPWRTILLADNLNELVNSDLITNLNPKPDPRLFADLTWIKPGRSVWSWWSDPPEFMSLPFEKHLIDRAEELGYEYTLLDEGWELWQDKWTCLKDVCQYAKKRGVSVFVWKHSKELNIPEDNYRVMALFLDSVRAVGVTGIKIDFMDSESKRLIDFDETALRYAAERKLLVNFHGCQKPSGEFRTYPNEITREGIRGLELNRMNQYLTGNHNVALVFTRCLLNNADYTPIGFSNPGETTWAHQLATGFSFTSPLLVVAEHPDTLLLNPKIQKMLPFLKAMPAVWDETLVLPESSIASKAVLARRKGDDWYWIALNGDSPGQLTVSTYFLGNGHWKAQCVLDDPLDPRNVIIKERMVKKGDQWSIDISTNGGAVIRFIKE